MANDVRFRASIDDKVSGRLDKMRDAFDRVGGKGSAASFFGNVGAKAVAKGFDLIGSAVGSATDFLADSVRAAMEEEESIAKLNTALKASVASWNGNTDAIEKTLEARMKLGFADDEQRQSLALLVTATNDVSKALDIQRVAMDLARLKNISLQEASEALIKVDNGQYKLLKSLGIELAENATQTDALAAVQKAAEGQAESFANTTSGKLTVAQVQLGEAMEKIGNFIIPILATAVDNLAKAFAYLSGDPSVKLTGVLGDIAGMIGWVIDRIKSLLGWIGDMIAAFNRGIDKVGDFIRSLKLIPDIPAVPGLEPGDFRPPGYASGGWAGLNGPEIIRVGERGPEFVSPAGAPSNAAAGGSPVVIPIMIDGRVIARVVDEHLYYAVRRAPAAGNPV